MPCPLPSSAWTAAACASLPRPSVKTTPSIPTWKPPAQRATRTCPRPPTFLFAAEMDSGASDLLLQTLNIPIAKILHGEQSFCYHRSACAGDRITVQSRIDDVYSKKNGALEFVVKSSRAVNQNNELVAEMRSVIVVRN